MGIAIQAPPAAVPQKRFSVHNYCACLYWPVNGSYFFHRGKRMFHISVRGHAFLLSAKYSVLHKDDVCMHECIGLIGRSWAMVFISGGYKVKIYDNQPGQATKAITEIRKQMEELQQAQMLRGSLGVSEQLALLSSHDDLQQALEGAFFVQESVFEELEAKKSVFQAVESHVGEDVILSSSTSCLMPSNVFSGLQNRSRCIISHPVNPPYYVRLVELVPHPDTVPAVMEAAHALMTSVGQAPVRLRKEIEGFALNRVQYAIIAESWRLVKDGILSVEDIDLVMTEGLGMRYAFIGPIETMHLNAPKGLEDYLERYRVGMRKVLSTFGPIPEFSGEEAALVNKEICELIPADQEHLSARRERRDKLLMALAKLKK
ncbi:lambda-crystallin homolog isoform X1 [Alosa sapidissima]|uniref:lambda-crystallin homolog isoform X1 n=1 Tax=Alosa sapidissima TaxID=34773 RepID=UPI001C082D6D|nr:lambda-crystallin homolog isoform X1 [Alosa sapidissima]XP_041924745.1 lambda-crystallin homolog isoform X1 [Alosa sapidissima]